MNRRLLSFGSLALVIVLGCGGGAADKLVGFFAPKVAAITPSFAAPGGQITLIGENMQGEGSSPLKVTLGGIEAPIVSRANDRLVVTVPANAPADSPVVVTTNYGSDTSGLGLIVGAPAVVAEVEPNNGSAAATVTGRNMKMSGVLTTADFDYFRVAGLSALLRYRVSTNLPGARLTINGTPIVVDGAGTAEVDANLLWIDGESIVVGLTGAEGPYQIEFEAIL